MIAYRLPDSDLSMAELRPKVSSSGGQFDLAGLADGDVFWVNNRNKRVGTLEASFRVLGKDAGLWQPDTGEVEPAPYLIANGRTTVPLRLDPYDAVFVVFLKPASILARAMPRESGQIHDSYPTFRYRANPELTSPLAMS